MSWLVALLSGYFALVIVMLGGRVIVFVLFVEAIVERYFVEFFGDFECYGDVARVWEIHDICHCLHWVVLDVEGAASLECEIGWLVLVLGARGFALEQLVRNFEIVVEVVEERLAEPVLVERLRAAVAVARVG